MSSFDQNYIEIEPFDREYGLDELLPLKILEKLSQHLLPEMPSIAICHTNGTLYFTCRAWQTDLASTVEKHIKEQQPERQCCIDLPGPYSIMLFPLIHELEPKGYMIIDCQNQDVKSLKALGCVCVSMLHQFMHLKYQTQLTSGLHGTVVEESYAQLKQKAEQLARSEEKYRHLAANLEKEVQEKTAEIKIAHAHLMQQEKLAAIGRLAAGVAHEINNPLGFMISNLNVLIEYTKDIITLMRSYDDLMKACTHHQGILPPEIEKHLKKAVDTDQNLDSQFLLSDILNLTSESINGAQRIQKIVADLKAVARPGETQTEPVDIHKNINAVLTIVNNRISDTISIVKQYHRVPLVPGNAQELNQIWLNLILNAIDALAGQGTITLVVQKSGDQVKVCVSDTGCGIPTKHMTKIFDPFFTTKDVGQGAGLGLHAVYHLVQRHNGTIDVTSKKGQGTTFEVCLPGVKTN